MNSLRDNNDDDDDDDSLKMWLREYSNCKGGVIVYFVCLSFQVFVVVVKKPRNARNTPKNLSRELQM